MPLSTPPATGYNHALIKSWVFIACGLLGVGANLSVAEELANLPEAVVDTTDAGYLSSDLYLYAEGIYDNPVNDGVSAKVSPELSAMDNLLFSMPVSAVFQHRSQGEDKPHPSRMDYQVDVLMDGVGLSFNYAFR